MFEGIAIENLLVLKLDSGAQSPESGLLNETGVLSLRDPSHQ